MGIAQRAVAAALTDKGFLDDIGEVVQTWKGRAGIMNEQLRSYACIPANGGWSMLVDAESMSLSSNELSSRLLTRGLVATTPMDGWGPSGNRYVRLTFGNETAERLADLGARFAHALE